MKDICDFPRGPPWKGLQFVEITTPFCFFFILVKIRTLVFSFVVFYTQRHGSHYLHLSLNSKGH